LTARSLDDKEFIIQNGFLLREKKVNFRIKILLTTVILSQSAGNLFAGNDDKIICTVYVTVDHNVNGRSWQTLEERSDAVRVDYENGDKDNTRFVQDYFAILAMTGNPPKDHRMSMTVASPVNPCWDHTFSSFWMGFYLRTCTSELSVENTDAFSYGRTIHVDKLASCLEQIETNNIRALVSEFFSPNPLPKDNSIACKIETTAYYAGMTAMILGPIVAVSAGLTALGCECRF